MRFDVFYRGQFICHFPMFSFQVPEFLGEIRAAFDADISLDLYASRIELL